MVAKPPPSTMNKEYEEMTNEYLKVRVLSIELAIWRDDKICYFCISDMLTIK
jgi:hypothetical protein